MTDPELRAVTVCITGHAIVKRRHTNVPALLKTLLNMLAEAGFRRFICGCRRGFDQMAAQAVLSLKESYPDVKLVLVMPGGINGKQQMSMKSGYGSLTHAKFLAGASAYCIAYLYKATGAAAFIIDYVKNQGVPVYNLMC